MKNVRNDRPVYIYIYAYTSQKNLHDTTAAPDIHGARAASVCSFRPAASQPGPMTPAAFRSPLSTSKVADIVTLDSGRQATGIALAGPECAQTFPASLRKVQRTATATKATAFPASWCAGTRAACRQHSSDPMSSSVPCELVNLEILCQHRAGTLLW